MQRTSLTILIADDRYHVSVDIGTCEYVLADFATPGEAGAYAAKWVTDRGLRFAPSAARELDRAQRTNAACVTFEVITIAQYDIVTDAAAHAWVEVSEGILPWPFIPASY